MALTDRQVRQAKKAGVLIDGNGLRLRVQTRDTLDVATGERRTTVRKSWTLRVTVKGTGQREIGLGSAKTVSLAEAREQAREMRKLAREGVDPLAHRKAQRAAEAAAAAKAMTFRECAEAYIAAHEASWRNVKHRQQWRNTLASYAYPVLGDLPVQEIDVALIMKVLEPIWTVKTETASRVRSRIENILDWATAREIRSGENPARWRGHMQRLLPARSKIAPVRHHKALPYLQLPGFMAALGSMPGAGASALAFAILTAARSGEVREMTWEEIDLGARLWTVPASRMKANREHRVPLSDAAMAILAAQRPAHGAPYAARLVFPGAKQGAPLSDMTLTAVLRRMAKADPPTAPAGLTAHGFRSTFRDWCSEQTNFPREVAEAALAHTVGDKVEAAYRRGDLFEKRRRLMDAWANYCSAWPIANAEIVSINRHIT